MTSLLGFMNLVTNDPYILVNEVGYEDEVSENELRWMM